MVGVGDLVVEAADEALLVRDEELYLHDEVRLEVRTVHNLYTAASW